MYQTVLFLTLTKNTCSNRLWAQTSCKKKVLKMADSRFSIVKLNNGNYQIWKYKVELLLIKDELWHTVNEIKPENPDDKWLKAETSKSYNRLVGVRRSIATYKGRRIRMRSVARVKVLSPESITHESSIFIEEVMQYET